MSVEEPSGQGWLAWWRSHPAVNVGVVVGLVGAVALAVLLVHRSRSSGTLDTGRLDSSIEHWMVRTLGSRDAVADCPSGESVSKGTEFLCDVRDTTTHAHVDVTVINDQGDVRWQLVG